MSESDGASEGESERMRVIECVGWVWAGVGGCGWVWVGAGAWVDVGWVGVSE